MFHFARVLPVFAACIALGGCGDGSLEFKSRPAAPSTVIIEKSSPQTVVVEKPSPPAVVIEKPSPPVVIIEKPSSPTVIVEKPRR